MIVDTEVHVIYRMFPRELNPERSMVEPWTWHELSGDLLVAEMDHAGVDKAFLISYGAEDLPLMIENAGLSSEEFISGKKYHKAFFKKYPERFHWFATIPNPRRDDCLETLKKDFDEGATGIKIFPAQINMNLNDPKLLEVIELVRKNGKRVMLGLEEATEKTPPLKSLLHQLHSEVLSQFSDVHFQLNHGGCIDPLSNEADSVSEMARRHDNLFLSTAFLGYTAMEIGYAPDQHEYPFPIQLKRLKRLYEKVGPEKLMFGTDWPWVEDCRKYIQDVDSIRRHADFMSAEDKEKFLGLNAIRYLGH
jgi:predicted TIM-barrel fold metal-dependent hydrolase